MKTKTYVVPGCTCYNISNQKNILLSISAEDRDIDDSGKVKGETDYNDGNAKFLWNE